jgi:hypothetical protein
VYAYREKAFQLVSLFLGGTTGSTASDHFKKSVQDSLRKADIGAS